VASDDDILKHASEHFRKMGSDPEKGGEIPPEELEARRSRQLNEKEVKVMGVYQYPQGGAFVLLRDTGSRNLPIWIGEPEAVSISLAIEGNATPRPMTHDLTKLVIERLSGSLEYILVDDLYNNIYYAKMVMRHSEKPVEIDCRPSDAIAMALRFKAPIYVADHVLEEGQWELSDEAP
jgi:uncharacterized protein